MKLIDMEEEKDFDPKNYFEYIELKGDKANFIFTFASPLVIKENLK